MKIRREAPRLFARDTQRIAQRFEAEWLSTEPLEGWHTTPLTLRMAASLRLQPKQTADYLQRILCSILTAIEQRPLVQAFANLSLQRPEGTPITWKEVAIKVSFWDELGERFPAPYIAQAVVQNGRLQMWVPQGHGKGLVPLETVHFKEPRPGVPHGCPSF